MKTRDQVDKYERFASSLTQVTTVCGVGSYALGFGTLILAIGIDTWGLFMGVAVFTAAASVLGVVAGIGSLLMGHLSKVGGSAWKRTLGFSILAAAYVPLMVLVWIGMGFNR